MMLMGITGRRRLTVFDQPLQGVGAQRFEEGKALASLPDQVTVEQALQIGGDGPHDSFCGLSVPSAHEHAELPEDLLQTGV
jgi:hypothetical protein